jgi:hypothetical protein
MTETIVDEETRLARARQSEELARWLREAGHRARGPLRTPVRKPELHPCPSPARGTFDALLETDPGRLARISVFGLLAVSYLQYFYFDVMLQVYSMHSLIFFILVNGHA